MLQGPLDAFVGGASHASAPSPDAVRIFGVTLIGATPHNLHKLLLTLGFIAVAWIFAWALRQVLKLFIGTRSGTRFQFWAKQGVSLVVAALVILGIMSIWFDSPAQLASVLRMDNSTNASTNQKAILAISSMNGKNGAGSSSAFGVGLYKSLYATTAAAPQSRVLMVKGKY